jgi:hypothetical protein
VPRTVGVELHEPAVLTPECARSAVVHPLGGMQAALAGVRAAMTDEGEYRVEEWHLNALR